MTDRGKILIDADLHRQVKATAALCGESIKDWVEGVIRDALAGRPSASVLVDTKVPYDIRTPEPRSESAPRPKCDHGMPPGCCAVCESEKRSHDPHDMRPLQGDDNE